MVRFKDKYEVFSEITYESTLPFALRFMIDNNINGMSWVKVKAKKY